AAGGDAPRALKVGQRPNWQTNNQFPNYPITPTHRDPPPSERGARYPSAWGSGNARGSRAPPPTRAARRSWAGAGGRALGGPRPPGLWGYMGWSASASSAS